MYADISRIGTRNFNFPDLASFIAHYIIYLLQIDQIKLAKEASSFTFQEISIKSINRDMFEMKPT